MRWVNKWKNFKNKSSTTTPDLNDIEKMITNHICFFCMMLTQIIINNSLQLLMDTEPKISWY